MKQEDAYAELRKYAGNANRRYPDDPVRLRLAIATRAITSRSPDASRAASPAALARIMSHAEGSPVSQRAARAALRRARSYQAAVRSSSPLLAAARALVAAAFADLSSIPFGRRSVARRAAVMIGWTALAEAQQFQGRVIVSARWLALKLAVVPETANRAITDLVDTGVLTAERKLRDQKTRTFRLRKPTSNADGVLLEILKDTVDEITNGLATAPGSITDVLRVAGSPLWTHAGAEVPLRSGMWAVALREAVYPAMADAARQYRTDAGSGNPFTRGAVELRGRLSVSAWGGASKNTRAGALSWLEQRGDRPFTLWVAELAVASGADVAATERADAAARARRASRKEADQVTGGRRAYSTPEEWAQVVVTQLSGAALPTDKDAAQVWLGRLSAGWPEGGAPTLARGAAARELIVRVLVHRAGVEPDKARAAAGQIVGDGGVSALGVAA